MKVEQTARFFPSHPVFLWPARLLFKPLGFFRAAWKNSSTWFYPSRSVSSGTRLGLETRVPDWFGFQATRIFKYSYSSSELDSETPSSRTRCSGVVCARWGKFSRGTRPRSGITGPDSGRYIPWALLADCTGLYPVLTIYYTAHTQWRSVPAKRPKGELRSCSLYLSV